MKLNYGYLLKIIPAWVPLTLLTVGFALFVIAPKVFSSSFIADNQLAYLSSINGDVNVSDGISDMAAADGPLIAGSVRTLLKTGDGNASMELRDGAFVVLDSSSTIEFNRQYRKNSNESFAFNLVSGRALVVNGQKSNIPTQVFVGGDITAQVFQAVMGLEAMDEANLKERADCLVGPCVINGGIQLVSGQSAIIGADGAVQVANEIPYDSWISLGKLGVFYPALSDLFSGVHLTPSPTFMAISTLTQTPIVILKSFNITNVPSPTGTLTFQRATTQTTTPTKTPKYVWPLASGTPLPVTIWPSTSTPVRFGTPTSTRSSTLTPAPSQTSYPTSSFTPQFTGSPVPTDTATLVPTGTATSVPAATATPVPAATATPVPTATATPVPADTATPIPADTATPIPADTATPVPANTATPIPVDTATLMPPPIDTSTPVPPAPNKKPPKPTPPPH